MTKSKIINRVRARQELAWRNKILEQAWQRRLVDCGYKTNLTAADLSPSAQGCILHTEEHSPPKKPCYQFWR